MHVHTTAHQRVCKGIAVHSGALRGKAARIRCFKAPQTPHALPAGGLGSSLRHRTSNRGVLLAPRAVDVAAPPQQVCIQK
jgi:hypothetical protein